jgi:hypothetical protein
MVDRYSETWRDVAAWAAPLLASARAELESPNVSDDRARYLRGRIATLKELLALPDAAEDQPAVDAPLSFERAG